MKIKEKSGNRTENSAEFPWCGKLKIYYLYTPGSFV